MSAGIERIYGWHAVRAFLARHPERIVAIRIAEARDDARVRGIAALARAAGCVVSRIDARELERLAGAPGGAYPAKQQGEREARHQGILAEVRALAPWGEDELIAALAAARDPLLLVLDGVQDPHNLGACLRPADACGALAVIVPKDRAAQLNATVRKVAAGAAESTPVVAVTNLARCLRLLKQAGLWIVGAAADAPKLVQDVDLRGPVALVLGAEGAGMRALTRTTCDAIVRLPQVGSVESLNVSVAAGMLLYEVLRQRTAAAAG
jgi:23S rRNA (guanosine2251-2'-O)-methyltransferase